MILSSKPRTKALIRLSGCADWSAPLLFANPRRQGFSRRAHLVIHINTPTKRSDAEPLVEREKQFECRPVEISRSLKGKQMLHVQYIIIINISFPSKRIKNRGMSCNL